VRRRFAVPPQQLPAKHNQRGAFDDGNARWQFQLFAVSTSDQGLKPCFV